MLDSRLTASRIWRSKYLRSVATLSGGQLLNTGIPVLAAPLLGRLYKPEDYGFLGAYMSVATVLAAIGNWQYSQAIIFETSEARARVALSVCIATSIITAILSIFVAAIMICTNPNTEGWWFGMLPASALIGGVSSSLIALANRRGQYHRIATVQLVPTLITVGISIGMGFQDAGNTGLMLAYLTGQAISLLLVIVAVRDSVRWRSLFVPLKRLAAVSIRHRRFPIYTLPSNFISSLTLNSPVYALQSIGAVAEIGLYTRANQLLSMPLTLLGSSVAQVYQRQAAEEFKSRGNCWSVYKRTLLMLAAAGVVPCVLLLLFAPQIFRIVLGPDWEDAGQIARILAPMLFLRLICSPLATTFYVVGAQREDFIISLVGYVALVSSIIGLLIYGADSRQIIASFSACYFSIYFVFVARSAMLSRNLGAEKP